jgi:hypothetical protein
MAATLSRRGSREPGPRKCGRALIHVFGWRPDAHPRIRCLWHLHTVLDADIRSDCCGRDREWRAEESSFSAIGTLAEACLTTSNPGQALSALKSLRPQQGVEQETQQPGSDEGGE